MKLFFGFFLLVGSAFGWCPASDSKCAAVWAKKSDKKPVVCGRQAKPECKEITYMENTFNCTTCFKPDRVRDLFGDMCKSKNIPTCADDAEPEMNRGDDGVCPSCKPAMEKDQCSKAKLGTCRTQLEGLADCTEKSDLKFDGSSCCMSCKPPAFECAKEGKKCEKAASDLPACAADRFEKSEVKSAKTAGNMKCCRSCIPKKIHDKKDDSGKKKWTKDEFKDAIRELPECELREVAIRDKKLPGPSCKRPQSKAALKEVVECLKDRQRCETFQEFRDVMPGQVCPACKPPRPTCAEECGDKKICIQRVKDEKKVTKCVRKRKFRLRLKAKKKMTELKKKMETMTKEEFVSLLEEVVARFCERTEEKIQKFCDNRQEAVLSSLKCTDLKKRKEGLDGEIEVSDEELETVDATGRRLLAGEENDTEGFFNDALNDSDEVEPDTDSGDGDDTPSPSPKVVATWGVTCLSFFAASFMLL